MTQAKLILALAFAIAAVPCRAADQVTSPPQELVDTWKLSPFYTKCVLLEGMPVVASAKASDHALLEAAYLIRKMVGDRTEILRAMATNHVRLVIMAKDEMTTDVPEHSDMMPKAYWDRRARGLGATKARPAVSCGEENLIEIPGDPYAAENILIHELSHAIHEMGLNLVDPTFDQRLRTAYEHAREKGLWKGTYASQNRSEYWAEAAQSWFDCNRANDKEHGPIDTREELKEYDPEMAGLLKEVYGDGEWRYTKPSRRPASELAHLAGYDRSKVGRFVWPARAPSLEAQGELLAWLNPDNIPSASPQGGRTKTTVNFVNRRSKEVSLNWLDFSGKQKHYTNVRPGLTQLESTYSGHVWVVIEDGAILGAVVAGENPGRVEIK